MNNIWIQIVALLVGTLLGGLFFGGLWLTIKMALNSKTPAVLFILSFFIRTAAVLGGFYMIAKQDSSLWIMCVCGFIVARFISKKYLKTSKENKLNQP